MNIYTEKIIPAFELETRSESSSMVARVVHRLVVETNEHQEELIMKEVRVIGGAEWEFITLDKNKVLEAFRLYKERYGK
jgi:hypothetical protein